MKLPFIALALAICASLASAQADEPDAKPRIGKCMTCHGADAKGTVVGTTDLTTGMYAWADGSVSGIKQGIADRMHTAPGMDGDLQPNDVVAVAVYVWSLAHQTH